MQGAKTCFKIIAFKMFCLDLKTNYLLFRMLKLLFLGILRRTCNVYGDCLMNDLGLAPIALASPLEIGMLERFDESYEETWARDFDR